MRIERTVELKAPPQRIYEVVMNPARLAEWVTIHHSLDGAPDGQLQEGSELGQSLKLAGQRLPVRWRVVQNDPCRRVVWEGHGPVRSRARVVYGFEPLEPSGDGPGGSEGTRFSYVNEYELPGGALGRLAGRSVARLAGKEADRSLERLRRLVED